MMYFLKTMKMIGIRQEKGPAIENRQAHKKITAACYSRVLHSSG